MIQILYVQLLSIEIGAGPLFDGLPSREHLHISAVGSDFPGKIELPLSFLKQSFVCPDFREQAVLEGECQQLKAEQIGASLFEVCKHPDRFTEVKTGRSVFDSTGLSLEDMIAQDSFFQWARELGLGQHIPIEYISEDAKHPYEFMPLSVKAY